MVNAAHVPSSSSTLSAQKKRQDERNLKILRELTALPANRYCFECGQRGPTYVNITHGSFCCTSCSGILRGLNPPHRVKSICMASFTAEEIERLRSLGNEENSHTWLGLYSGAPPKMTNKDEITSFLVKKYEKKEWYVSRSELEEQERLLNQAKEVSSQCGTSVQSAGSSSSKPSDLDLFATDPFAAFGAPMNRPVPHSFDNSGPPNSHLAQAIPTQPFSPPAFVAPPPPLPTKPPVQHTSATQVADPFAPVSAKSATTEFDPFADFDAKFSELVLKSSSTVNAFESPLPVQPLPKSATVDTSFPIPQPANTSQLFNPFQSQASEDTQSLNAATFCERAPITRNCDNSDKYSALAELDQMFHHSGRPNAAGGEKPPWLPSGFSTGLPPAHYTQAFADSPQTQRVASSCVGSIPKSNTFGAIAEVGSVVVPQNTPSFDILHQQGLSSSYANIASNPFVQQPFANVNSQQIPVNSELSYSQASGTWNNPFAVPFALPRYGADAAHGAGGVARQSNAPNWNPFV